MQTAGGAWGGRPPEDDGTHTLEAHRTDALQGVTKEEGTLRGRRRRRGGKRHEKLAKATAQKFRIHTEAPCHFKKRHLEGE